MIQPVVQPEHELDVFFGIQEGNKVIGLECEPDFLPPQRHPFLVAHLRKVHAVNQHLAAGGGKERSQDREHGRFAGTAGSHQRDEFTGVHLKRDIVHGIDRAGVA